MAKDVRFNSVFHLGEEEDTYLWMVDIVGYSKVTDSLAQEELIEHLFNCIYGAVKNVAEMVKNDERRSKDLSSDDATVIWTGDGAIIATKYPFGLETPLLLTTNFIALWRKEDWTRFKINQKTKETPKVHIAAHFGKCRWLQNPTLRSPLFEVSNCFGVDINYLARIATFSTSNGDFISSNSFASAILNESEENSYKLQISEEGSTLISFDPIEFSQVNGKGNDIFEFRKFHVSAV